MENLPKDPKETVENEHCEESKMGETNHNKISPVRRILMENIPSTTEIEIAADLSQESQNRDTDSIQITCENSFSDSDTSVSSTSESSTSLSGSSTNDTQSEEELKPIFITDGIAGDLRDKRIISKVYLNQSPIFILNNSSKNLELNRDIWLSIGNFLILMEDTKPSIINTPNKIIKYRQKTLTAFKKSILKFKQRVNKKGGRVYVMEVFPPPCMLDEDRATSKAHHKAAWRLYIGLNKVIHSINMESGATRTLNVNSYLRERVYLKKGKRCLIKKSVVELSSEEEFEEQQKEHRLMESKLKPKLHEPDGLHLLEPIRLVVSHVIMRAITNTK